MTEKCLVFLISDFRRDLNIENVLLGISPAFEDGTDTGFRNVGKLQIDAWEIPKRTFSISVWWFTEQHGFRGYSTICVQ